MTLHTIFGTGPVGMAIARELHTQGHEVRMVNRSGVTAQPLPEGVELHTADLSHPQAAIAAAVGSSVIYHALNPAYHRWVELFPALFDGALAAAEAQQVPLVVMDNLYMYGDPRGKPLTETMPYAAHTIKGRLRAELANRCMHAHESGRVQVTIGRAADFIGPAVQYSAMGADLVLNKVIQGTSAQVMGNIDLPHSYSYVPDIGRALVALAQSGDSWGQVWHLPTPPAVSSRCLLEMLYAEAGYPCKVQVVPKWLLRIVGLFDRSAKEVVEMLYQFQQPFVVDDTKFVQRFGWGATDLETVVRETVQWFKAQATNIHVAHSMSR